MTTQRKITIDPVTRVEGHGRVTVQLDEEGRVGEARFHIVEFRGFERFIQGHPYWQAPLLVQRLCGICPVSHHLAASKAVDQIYGADPEDLTQPTNPSPWTSAATIALFLALAALVRALLKPHPLAEEIMEMVDEEDAEEADRVAVRD